jgi:hypothetical protein
MGNFIQEAISAFCALLITVIAFTVFSPMMDKIFSNMVISELADYAGTALAINVGSLDLTRVLILTFFRVIPWLLIFCILSRLFLKVAFDTEEQGVV